MTKGDIQKRSEAAALLGSLGGRARLTTMTAKERIRVAKLGAEARWKNHRKSKGK